jgi:PII-like signaling protein
LALFWPAGEKKRVKLEGEQTLLRIYLRNTDKQGWFAPPAAEVLVQRARQHGLAGSTVLRGFLGLDFTGQLLESRAWSLVDHVPIIVEIVDQPRAIGPFLTVVEQVVPEGLATLERAHVVLYRHSGPAAARVARRLEVPQPISPLSTLPLPEEFPIMRLSENGQLLRVFIGESDTWEGQPLYRAIVLKARELGLAGATVLRGPMGFGANSRVQSSKLLELSTDLPIVVEIVDTAEKLQALLPFLDQAVDEGLITIEEVRVLKYRHNADRR